jgi:hypothetical protein
MRNGFAPTVKQCCYQLWKNKEWFRNISNEKALLLTSCYTWWNGQSMFTVIIPIKNAPACDVIVTKRILLWTYFRSSNAAKAIINVIVFTLVTTGNSPPPSPSLQVGWPFSFYIAINSVLFLFNIVYLFVYLFPH